MVTCWTHLRTADPWVECMVRPFDGRVLHFSESLCDSVFRRGSMHAGKFPMRSGILGLARLRKRPAVVTSFVAIAKQRQRMSKQVNGCMKTALVRQSAIGHFGRTKNRFAHDKKTLPIVAIGCH